MINCNEMADRVFREMDIKHDNKISKEEFLEASMKNHTISEMLVSKVLKIVTTDT